jgi:hypothetical protein
MAFLPKLCRGNELSVVCHMRSWRIINVYYADAHQVSVLDERNAQLDREKAALADLLAAKKREYDQMRQHYRDRVADLEDETQRLKAEKLRLVDKLQLPESERTSLVVQVSYRQHVDCLSAG